MVSNDEYIWFVVQLLQMEIVNDAELLPNASLSVLFKFQAHVILTHNNVSVWNLVMLILRVKCGPVLWIILLTW